MLNSDEYGKRTLDFVERLQNLSDYDEIASEIRKEFEWFGLPYVTIFNMPGPGIDPMDCILMNNRPTSYVENYIAQNHVEHDPVVTELFHTVEPYTWTDIKERRKLAKFQKKIMDECIEFEATDGIIIPVIQADGSLSVVSPCGRKPDLSQRARSAIEIIATYAHQALQRARIRNIRGSSHIPLTNREREVMLWVAAGKTDDEIGEILSIGRDTVTRHVEHAKMKLNASRRTFAVIQALRFGELSL